METHYEVAVDGDPLRLKKYETYGEVLEHLGELQSLQNVIEDLQEAIGVVRAEVRAGNLTDAAGNDLVDRLTGLQDSQRKTSSRLLKRVVAVIAERSDPPLEQTEAEKKLIGFSDDPLSSLRDVVTGFITSHKLPEDSEKN